MLHNASQNIETESNNLLHGFVLCCVALELLYDFGTSTTLWMIIHWNSTTPNDAVETSTWIYILHNYKHTFTIKHKYVYINREKICLIFVCANIPSDSGYIVHYLCDVLKTWFAWSYCWKVDSIRIKYLSYGQRPASRQNEKSAHFMPNA